MYITIIIIIIINKQLSQQKPAYCSHKYNFQDILYSGEE